MLRYATSRVTETSIPTTQRPYEQPSLGPTMTETVQARLWMDNARLL